MMLSTTTRRTLVLGLSCWLAGSSVARAHFIWADVQPPTDAPAVARFYFGELPRPGELELIDKIGQTRAWVRGADNRVVPLKLARSQDALLAALVADFAPLPAASLEATCDYGVFQRGPASLLLQYYAKHLLGDWTRQDQKLARAEKLRLDIVPSLTDDQLGLRVLFEDKPDPDREVIVLDPSGKQHELKTDDAGRVAITVTPGGSYAIRAAHVEADRGGQRDGKTYSQTWHYSTLTLKVPPAPAESAEASAAELLTRAREARSVWRDFPGFSADLTVSVDGNQATGRVVVDAQGEVSLELSDARQREWVDEQLRSLVQHRLPDDSVGQGSVKYADSDRAHPLGRKIDLGDPELGSVYRIKNDVIMEVTRKMGKTRFTISVLEAVRDAEHKYLPRAFTMSFFDDASGALQSNRSFWNDWQRVAAFDLPKTILEITARDGTVETKQMVLSNWRLLDRK